MPRSVVGHAAKSGLTKMRAIQNTSHARQLTFQCG